MELVEVAQHVPRVRGQSQVQAAKTQKLKHLSSPSDVGDVELHP